MSEAAEDIQTESTEGGVTENKDIEGVKPIGDGKIDMTETTDKEQEEDDAQARYDRIREKYNNDKDKIIKAYDDAQRKITKLSNDKPLAPEKYEFDLSEIEGLPEDFVLDEDNPLLKEMLPVFKENNITGKAAQELARKFIEIEIANSPNEEAELKKLGADKDEILNRILGFVDNKAPEEFKEEFESWTATALGSQALHWAISQMGERPMADNVEQTPAKSSQELKDEAFAYRDKHSKTISGNRKQQEHYNNLMIAAQRAAEKEEKA